MGTQRRLFTTLAAIVFIGGGAACASGARTSQQELCPGPEPGGVGSIATAVRIGLISDTHGTAAHVADAITQMSCWSPHLLAHCGDIAYEQADYAGAIAPILSAFAMSGVPRALVLGNHDVNNASLTLAAIRAAFPADAASWLEPDVMYGYLDLAGVRFIVLDATYQSREPATRTGLDSGTNDVGGYIPQVELDWLTRTIDASPLPCVIFTHQPLLIDTGVPMISNGAAVRTALEARRRKVAAVVNGHNHRPAHAIWNGINYFACNAMSSSFESITTHDLGLHQQLEVDTASRTVRFSFWENDSVKGYLEVRTIVAPY